MRLICNPRRKRHIEVVAERLGVALVKTAHLAKPLNGMTITANTYSALTEQSIELLITLGGKAVGAIADGGEREDLRQVDHGMPCHGKGQLGLARFMTLYTCNEQR